MARKSNTRRHLRSLVAEIRVSGEKAKTRTAPLVPISTRLHSTLEMRKVDPTGRSSPPQAYVFGNAVGQQVKSVRTALENGTEALNQKNRTLLAGSLAEHCTAACASVSFVCNSGNVLFELLHRCATRAGGCSDTGSWLSGSRARAAYWCS